MHNLEAVDEPEKNRRLTNLEIQPLSVMSKVYDP